jgi:molybdopterin converting factor small subunit
VNVRLFAALREIAGASTVEVDAATAGGVVAALTERFGSEFGRIAAAGTVVVDGEPAGPSRALQEDSEVAVLPPVSGGTVPATAGDRACPGVSRRRSGKGRSP